MVSGGGSNFDLDTKLRYLESRGHEVFLITIFSSDNKFISEVPYQIMGKESPKKFFGMQKYICDVLKKYENDTDVYYLHGPVFLWAGGRYRKEGGCVPVVVFANNYTPGMNLSRVGRGVKNWIWAKKHLIWEKIFGLNYAKYVDKIIADSPIVKNIYSTYGISDKKIEVMPNFIDLEELKESKKAIKKHDSASKNNYLSILYVGRLVYDKGVDIVIRAINLIDKELKENSKIFFHIVGDGPEKENLKSQILNLKLENKVFVHGWKSRVEIIDFFKNTDVFINPAIWPEPFGRTVVEAMYFNKPIITSAGNGSSWVMGENGLSFKNKDARDLKEKILKFYNNRGLLDSYGRGSQKRAEQFDYRKSAEKFEKLLLELGRKGQ